MCNDFAVHDDLSPRLQSLLFILAISLRVAPELATHPLNLILHCEQLGDGALGALIHFLERTPPPM